jgi:hypothetical protein
VQPLWKTIWRLLKNVNIDLPYDPAIPLLEIYQKECDTDYSRGTCTPIFIATLVTIAKLWKQSRCPTTDKWIKKMCYLYTMEFYLAMRRMKSYYSQINRWNWRTSFLVKLARLRRPKIVCSPSYEDFRSRANTAMLLDLGHVLKGEHI